MSSTFIQAIDEFDIGHRRRNPSSGRARRRTKAVRLIDVARAAGVSIATVSMVVNGHPRISPSTQKRVRRMIDKLGYRPNRAMPMPPAGRRAPVLAVLLPAGRRTFADGYFGELISGISDRASMTGQTVQFEHVTPQFLSSGQHRVLLEQHSADGLLLVGFSDDDAFLDELAPARGAIVAVDSQITRCEIESVGCDYRSGAQQAMNYLLQLGHRRIGLITASAGRCAAEVSEVYRSAMAAYGACPGDEWVVDGRFTEEGGDEATDRILARHPDVTAIFAASDKMAIGAIHCAARRGLSVPRDLSIIGFDNLRHAAFMNPPLSTVHLPLQEVGARACARLIDRLGGRQETANELVATHLVVRESTALCKDLPPSEVESSAA